MSQGMGPNNHVRFSFASLLGFITTVSLLLGGWVWQGRRQADAVRAFERLGGHVYYHTGSVCPQQWVDQLCSAIGEDYVRRVHTACPGNDPFEESLPHLKRLRGLQRIYYWLTPPEVTAERVAAELPGVALESKFLG